MRHRTVSVLTAFFWLASGLLMTASVNITGAPLQPAAPTAWPSLSSSYCYNWDFFNNSGSPANDLHLTLFGPTAVSETFSNPAGQGVTSPGPNSTLSLNFTFFSLVGPGDAAHVGFCANAPVFQSPGVSGLPPFYWTLNGQPLAGGSVPVLPMPGWNWTWQGDQRGHFQIGLSNANSIPITVQSLRIYQPNGLLPLSNLNMSAVGGLTPLWSSTGPVTINPTISSFFDIFLEITTDGTPPTERTPLIAVAVISNPIAPPPLNTINLLAQTLFVMPPPPLYCFNWDFVNNTGQVANDLHIILQGPRVLSNVYMGSLNPFGAPDPRSGYDAATGLYTLWYSGASVASGASVHTGFCSDNPAVSVTHYWTLNGAPIGQPVPVPGWQWQWQADGNVQVGLSNPNTTPMTITAVRWALTPQAIPLNSLVWSNPLVQALTFTTLPGTTLPPGGNLVMPLGVALPANTIVVGNAQVAGAGGQVVQLMAQGRVVLPPPALYCYNWDFANWTGQPVNDLHLTLSGPTQLSDVYLGPLNPFGLPDARSRYDAATGIYHLWWSGATVAPGSVVHVGFCSDRPIVSFPAVGVLPPHYWTWNGAPVGGPTPIPVPSFAWQWAPNGSLDFGLALAAQQPAVQIEAIEIAPVAALFDLDTLTYADLSTLVPPGAWATMLPQTGLLLPAGGQLHFTPPPNLSIRPGQPLVIRLRAVSTLDPNNIIWVAAQAAAPPALRWWENYDIHVPPEAGPITDLHLELSGVGPSGIFDFFPSPFFGPSAQQTYNPSTGVTSVDFLPVDWTVSVPVSTTLHMGMHTGSDRVRLLRGWWTRDGQPVGPPIGMGSIIFRGLPAGLRESTNVSSMLHLGNDMPSAELEVQTLEWAVIPAAIPLEDMTWDHINSLGLAWTTVAPPVVVLPPDSHLDFLVTGSAGHFVLVRTQTRVPGGPSVRNLAQHLLTLQGDLDNSCSVTVLDINDVALHWDTALGNAAFDPLYDLDDSGAVTVQDILLVAESFGATCAP